MPPPRERASSTCLYIVSSVLFVAIVAGGALLGLYVALPNSSAWFPFAGLALVATPWLFWISTCIYKASPLRKRPRGGADEEPAAASPAAAEGDAAVCSPGGERRVRFGAVTVISSATDVLWGGGSSSGGGSSPEKAEDEEHPHATAMSSNEERSSVTSHDHERDLQFFAAS